MLIQSSIFDWLGSNFAYMLYAFSMLWVIILIIYIKAFVRYFYEGTLYRHYRRGKLIKESDQGGLVALIPFFDRLEVFEEENDDYPVKT
jgi:hypothetical protein